MQEVGVRELRDHLSRYLAQVQDGEEVVVTDHGRPVARLVGMSKENVLERLIAEGVVTRAKEPHRSLPRKLIKATQPISPLVSEQRG